jgi:hypothetical protein
MEVSVKLRHFYLILAVLGAVLPLSQFIGASIEGTFTFQKMIDDLTQSRITAGFTLDLLVAAVAGLLFMLAELRRRSVPGTWIAVIGTVAIGFSFGLPFFLFLRERAIATQARTPQAGPVQP